MKNLFRYLRLYGLFVAQHLKKLMEYRTDFFIGLLGFLLTQAAGVLTIVLVFQFIPNLNGWTFAQMMFIYGFAQIPRGIDHLITDNFWMLSGRIIRQGEFDRYLLRPIPPLFHLIAEVFQLDAVGELVVGMSLIILSVTQMPEVLTLTNVLVFLAAALLGAVIYSSIKLFFASFAFWIKTSQAILFLAYMFSDFVKYPMPIFHPWIRAFLTIFLPFAFTAYFPAAYFLGKESMWMALGGTAIAAVCTTAAAYFMWRKGIDAYESSGS